MASADIQGWEMIVLLTVFCQARQPGKFGPSANWMRTLEFAIWGHAQTSALRHDLSSSLKRSLWPDASIQLLAAARPANHRRVLPLARARMTGWRYDSVSDCSLNRIRGPGNTVGALMHSYPKRQ
jgi:hypothetical protein